MLLNDLTKGVNKETLETHDHSKNDEEKGKRGKWREGGNRRRSFDLRRIIYGMTG